MIIGKAELFNIDCVTYMAELPDRSFDLAIVDPPYGRGEHGGYDRSSTIKQKNGVVVYCKDGGYKKKDWDSSTPDKDYFIHLKRVSKNQIIFGVNYMPELMTGGRIVWDKLNDGSIQSGAEIAYCSLHSRVDIVRYMWRGMFQGLNINSFEQQGDKSLNEKRIHPTQKPVKLYEWLLSNYAKPGQRILDTHLGSGSSAIACNNLGYEMVGCELDEDYYRDACARVNQASKQERLFP